MDIKYSRQYIIVLQGIFFPVGTKNTKNSVGKSAEARILRAKNTEKYIPKNMLFSPMTEQLLFIAEHHITKNEDFCEKLVTWLNHSVHRIHLPLKDEMV